MDSIKLIQDSFRTRVELHSQLAESLTQTIQDIAEVLIRSIQCGGKIFFCGNGGSAADSQHLVAELVGRFERQRKGLPAIALTTDTSVITSVGNDYGFDRIFERQIEALGRPGDVLVGISTSGKSKNVVLAMQKAREMSLSTIAFCGKTPGPVTELADISLQVPATRTVLIQEGHIVAGHILCDLVEATFSSDLQ